MECLPETLQACAQLTASFAVLVDHQRYDELAALFTEDCAFERPGVNLHGREELRAFMAARPIDAISRHVCTMPLVEQIGPDAARGITYLVFYEGESAPSGPASLKGATAFAEYHDEFRRTAEGWRIARRQVRPVMIQR